MSNDTFDDEQGRNTYALGLDNAVNEATGQGSKDLLGLGVAVGLAVLRDVVLVSLSSLVKKESVSKHDYGGSATHLVGRSGGNELVGELGLVGGVGDLDRMG